MPEATPEFKRRLQEAFDEIYVGQTFTFRRTFTNGDVALFCGVTVDYNPYHQDEAFARESPYGRLTIPGLLIRNPLEECPSWREHPSGGTATFASVPLARESDQPDLVSDF
ncbi:MAG: 3-hydroxybutyryl-CoA dehydratase [Rubrobacteraceae bacterium]|nr:3-hydroxybutyryl-CoA dehydratase [Rubrobacteraceae bacterium]